MNELPNNKKSQLIATGVLAAFGALVVGIGEFTFQFSPRGGYEDPGYLYFLDVSSDRLTFGHFLGVLCAPLYLVGYWHVSQMLRPAGRWLAAAVFGLGVYAFAIGNVWLGGRVNLALIVQARDTAPPDSISQFTALLADAANHNEPLINIVRVLIAIVSLLLAWGILSGRSHYPRWAIVATPFVLLAAIFGLYAVLPAVGVYALPAAMNIAHLVFFLVSALAATRISSTG